MSRASIMTYGTPEPTFTAATRPLGGGCVRLIAWRAYSPTRPLCCATVAGSSHWIPVFVYAVGWVAVDADIWSYLPMTGFCGSMSSPNGYRSVNPVRPCINSIAQTPTSSTITNLDQNPLFVPAPRPPSMTIAAASNPSDRSRAPITGSSMAAGTSRWSTLCRSTTTASRSAIPEDAALMYALSDRSLPVLGSGSYSALRRMSSSQWFGTMSGGRAFVRYSGTKAIFLRPTQDMSSPVFLRPAPGLLRGQPPLRLQRLAFEPRTLDASLEKRGETSA